MTRRGTLALTGIAVLIVGALALPRHAPSTGARPLGEAQPARVEAAGDVAPISSPAADAPPVVVASAAVARTAAAAQGVKEPSKKAAASRTAKNRMAESPLPSATLHAPMLVADAPMKADAAARVAALEPTPAESAAASSAVAGIAPVTVRGCLEVSLDDGQFRLTDTEGVDAPKSRSWRTAFLKKRAVPVALVEPPDPHALRKDVGKRVAATGVLTKRDLAVSSLNVIGASCN